MTTEEIKMLTSDLSSLKQFYRCSLPNLQGKISCLRSGPQEVYSEMDIIMP